MWWRGWRWHACSGLTPGRWCWSASGRGPAIPSWCANRGWPRPYCRRRRRAGRRPRHRRASWMRRRPGARYWGRSSVWTTRGPMPSGSSGGALSRGGGAWSALAPEVREGLARYLEAVAGLAGREILGRLRAARGAMRWRLASSVGCSLRAMRRRARHSCRPGSGMEPWIDGRTIQEAAGRRWASASAAVLGPLASEERRRIHLRAEVLLQELRAEGLAVLSDDLPASWEARLRTWAEHLGEVGRAPSRPALDRAEGAWQALVRHRSWQDGEEGRSRLAMARRLGWALLEAPLPAEAAPVSLVEAAGGYAATLAWMDRAREELVAGVGALGEAAPALESAFDALWQRVTERREAFNQRFGRLLSQWVEAGSGTRGPLLGVEVLRPGGADRPPHAGPLAGARRHERAHLPGAARGRGGHGLGRGDARRGWRGRRGWRRGGIPVRHQAVAMLPTVTEVSRASLLCGDAAAGHGADEKEGFEGAPGAPGRVTGRPPAAPFSQGGAWGRAGGDRGGGAAGGAGCRPAGGGGGHQRDRRSPGRPRAT